jgi:hypothetical protein
MINPVEIDHHSMYETCLDMEGYIELLRKELTEDFDANCRTERLTEKQRQLLPLFAQMITAVSTWQLADVHAELTGYAEKMAARR